MSFVLHPFCRLWIPCVIVVTLTFCISPCFAGESVSAFVPVEEPVYGFLDRCVERGILPVWSVNTRPISRSDVGRMLKIVTIDYPRLDDRILEADLDYYLREFAFDIESVSDSVARGSRTLRLTRYNPEKALEDPHWHAATLKGDKHSFVFDPLISFRYDIARDDNIFRRATGIQFRGDYKRKIGYYFRFIDHVERGKEPYKPGDRSLLIEDRWGYVEPQKPRGNEVYYDMTEAYLTVRQLGIDLVFGKERIAWGPAKQGGLLLSGLSPSFGQLRTSVALWDKVRFTHVIGSLHAYNTHVDTMYQTAYGWTRLSLAQKWLAAHRIEYTPWDFAVVAVNEAVIWGERGLDASYVNPLNFYYSAEHNGGDRDNVLMSGDIIIRIRNYGSVYGELLIDDMKISTLGEGDPGNKFGFLCGGVFSNCGVDGLVTGMEYTRIDPYVYTHFIPINRYTTWTSSLGSNIGTNSDRLRWWVSFRPLRQLELILNLDRSCRGEVGSNPNEAVDRNNPGSAHFLEGSPVDWATTEVIIKWEPVTGVLLKTGWINNEKRSRFPNRFYLNAGYRY